MSKFLVRQAFAEAMDLHKQNRFEEAKELLHSMGEHQLAVNAIKKSLKIDKKLFQSHYSLGIIYTDMFNFEKAIASYTTAIEIDNNSSEAHNNLANLFNSMDNQEAEYHYKKTIELVPNEIYPRLNIANYFIKNGKFDGQGIYTYRAFNCCGNYWYSCWRWYSNV